MSHDPLPGSAATFYEQAKVIAPYFHKVYEELAPQFGYETRRESAVDWDDVPEQNKRLMVATIGGLLAVDVIRPGEGPTA